jgi:hypothetical protein
VPGGSVGWGSKCRFGNNATEQLTAESESLDPKAVSQESKVPDAHEAFRQYMEKEAAQELDSVKSDHA